MARAHATRLAAPGRRSRSRNSAAARAATAEAGGRRCAHRCDDPSMRPAIFALGAAAAPGRPRRAAPHAPALAAALGIARPRRGRAGGVALTFDDGPHPSGTPAVLDALERAGARATFFLVGEQVAPRPVARARDRRRGARGGPPRRPPPLPAAPDPRARSTTTSRAWRRRSPTPPVCAPALYRPPYGVFSAAGLALAAPPRLARPAVVALGLRLAGAHDGAAIARRATRDLSAGDVVLLHDADTYSAAGVVARHGAGAAGGAGGRRAARACRPCALKTAAYARSAARRSSPVRRRRSPASAMRDGQRAAGESEQDPATRRGPRGSGPRGTRDM